MLHTDDMHVIHTCAAGLDVRKIQITATVRRARPDIGEVTTPTA